MNKYFNNILTLSFFVLLFVLTETGFSQFSLGIESGADFSLAKSNTFNNTFYLSPRLDVPHMTFSYGWHPAVSGVIGKDASLHTLNGGYRIDIGNAPVKPYAIFGPGFAFYNTPNKYLIGGQLFGVFGLSIDIVSKGFYYGTAGISMRYNVVLFNAADYFFTGDFESHHFLTSALAYMYEF